MVKVEKRVIVHGHPLGQLVIKLGNVVLLRILVPLLKRSESITAVHYVRKPQTEAGDRESERPHFGILSMRAYGALAPLLTNPLIHAGVRIVERMFAIVHNAKATIIFPVARHIQV